MYNHILPVWTLEATNRLHRVTAGTHPIPWFPVIDMPGVEAERTVVAMMPSAGRWTDETATVFTLEDFSGRLFKARLTTLIWAIVALFLIIIQVVPIVCLFIQTQKLFA